MGLILAASIAFGVGGAVMKWTDGAHRVWALVVLGLLFLAGAYLLAAAVRTEGLSAAYLIGLGFEAAVAAGLGWWWFDERFGAPQVIGLVLIAAGVASMRLA
jgi:multidrug transporter EmrE-like cation transporter